jgi:hypothetical protein
MIILLRGNHGSGKSTVVHKVMAETNPSPIFGVLGLKMPEAYRCVPAEMAKRRFYVLGPYESHATAGCDYITKLGVVRMVEFLEQYRQKGDILFESIMTSVRIMEPSIGKWIAANKKDVLVATLTTTIKECAAAIEKRKLTSVNGTRWNSKHLEAQQRMYERVTSQYEEMGFRQEYVSRDDAPGKILGWLREK